MLTITCLTTVPPALYYYYYFKGRERRIVVAVKFHVVEQQWRSRLLPYQRDGTRICESRTVQHMQMKVTLSSSSAVRNRIRRRRIGIYFSSSSYSFFTLCLITEPQEKYHFLFAEAATFFFKWVESTVHRRYTTTLFFLCEPVVTKEAICSVDKKNIRPVQRCIHWVHTKMAEVDWTTRHWWMNFNYAQYLFSVYFSLRWIRNDDDEDEEDLLCLLFLIEFSRWMCSETLNIQWLHHGNFTWIEVKS